MTLLRKIRMVAVQRGSLVAVPREVGRRMLGEGAAKRMKELWWHVYCTTRHQGFGDLEG